MYAHTNDSELPYPVHGPLDTLAQIDRAWTAGRPIVPLFGAGLSIDAGIPGSAQIAEYLAKVKYLRRAQVGASADYGTPLGRFGPDEWPGFFDVNRQILLPPAAFADAEPAAVTQQKDAFGRSDREKLTTVLTEVVRELMVGVPILSQQDFALSSFEKREQFLYSIFSNWRTLLRRLTAGNAYALEVFFENIMANRRPGKGHLFAASLSRLFGWRLMLTTNVDNLLEDALSDLGRRALVLTLPDRGPIEVARDQSIDITLLKLHGNRFSHRQSDALDAAPDRAMTESFLQMIPDRALLLALGYRGGDERVMKLVTSFLEEKRGIRHEPQVIWIARSYVPPLLQEIAKQALTREPGSVLISRFASVTSFLQELYTYLTSSFPASRQGYSATSALIVPRLSSARSRAGRSGREVAAETTAPTTIFIGGTPRMGSSSALAEFVARHERTHMVVWIDLEEIHSAEDLIDAVMAQLRSHDSSLPHFPSAFGSTDDGALRDSNRNVDRLTDALRRGRYLLALDSMGEFGRAFAAHDLTAPANDLPKRYECLLDLLCNVAERSSNIGESQLAMVLAPPYLPVYAPPHVNDSERFRPMNERGRGGPSGPTATYGPPSQPDAVTDDLSVSVRLREAIVIPDECSHLHIVGSLGQGGFGRVIRVFDPRLQYTFALKLFQRGSLSARSHALAEARRAIRLNHPNIVRVYQVSETDASPFILYDFVDGPSLAQLIQSDVFSLRQRVRVLADISTALAYAHENIGVAHGDLKPSNILVDQHGRGMLIDFGMGATRRYMSPEQCLAARDGESMVDPDPKMYDPQLSDVFSLGCVLFEVATKKVLFDVVESRGFQGPMPRLREIDATLPASLEHICSRCLAQKASDRYRSMRELDDALDSWLREDTAGQLGGLAVLRHNPELHVLYQNALARFEKLPDDTVHLITPSGVAGYFPSSQREDALARITSAIPDAERHHERIVGHGNSALASLQLSWNYLKPEYQAILAIAAAFRRPRSLVAMRLIGSMVLDVGSTYILTLLESLDQRQSEALPRGDLESASFSADITTRRRRFSEIDKILDELNATAFLVRQEGGYYWMHAGTRDAIYHSCAQKEPRGMANLHERIAEYYYEMVYARAKDTRAFFEFVFHQVAAFRDGSAETRHRRLKTLSAAFRRERNELLARAHHRALLDCITSLRDHTFKPLLAANASRGGGDVDDLVLRAMAEGMPMPGESPPANGPVEANDATSGSKEVAEAQLLDEAGRFVSLLCDLEADVHRRLTDYRRCIDVRLEQMRHRCQSLGLVDLSRMTQIQESVTRILASQPQVTGAVTTNDNSELPGTSFGREMWEQFQSMCEDLSAENRCIGNPLFRRLLDHVFDIAIAFAGLHHHGAATWIFGEIQALFDDQRERDARRADGSTRCRPIIVDRSIGDDVLRWVNAMRTHASLRFMESWNSRVYTWPTIADQTEATTNILRESQLASAYLGMLSDRNPDQYVRNTSWLKTLMARAHYLNGRFDQAHFLLDSAMASVDNATGVKVRVALALCDLRRAECHMLQSDAILRQALSNAGQVATESSSNASDLSLEPGLDELVSRKAYTHLMLASDSVRRVKNLLADETGHVWLWTLLYLEEAQLRHEEILFSIGNRQQRAANRDTEKRGWLIRQGLSSIAAGVDNIAKDLVRWSHFRTLWWQFFVCMSLDFPNRDIVSCWQFYRQMNAEAGLAWYWERKSGDKVVQALNTLDERRKILLARDAQDSTGWSDRQELISIEETIAR